MLTTLGFGETVTGLPTDARDVFLWGWIVTGSVWVRHVRARAMCGCRV